MQQLSDVYLVNWHGFESVENSLNDLADLYQTVHERIQNLELKHSKIQYEMTGLEEKLAETNEAIDNFQSKVRNTSRRFYASCVNSIISYVDTRC